MVEQIEQAFDANLEVLSWMDAATKARALEKAKAIFDKIGYPDKWKTYDGLVTDRGTFLGNHMRSMAYENARDLKKIGKPLDRALWLMTPPTVNAYYEPPMNEIVFPAGILQPPFFNKEATDAVNFGSMGMVVGHELTHGFDDEGAKVRREGQPHRLVDAGVGQGLRRPGVLREAPVRRLRLHRRPPRQRGADARRERGRPWRAEAGLRCDAGLREGPSGAHRGSPAGLPPSSSSSSATRRPGAPTSARKRRAGE